MQSISQLGNALSKEHVDPSTKIRVVWPKEKCKMLGEEVVIIDSPGKYRISNFHMCTVSISTCTYVLIIFVYYIFLGIDVETDLDAWIDRVCLDR